MSAPCLSWLDHLGIEHLGQIQGLWNYRRERVGGVSKSGNRSHMNQSPTTFLTSLSVSFKDSLSLSILIYKVGLLGGFK